MRIASVKDIIFESLSLVEADTYRPIFLDAAKDMKLSMSIKMDESSSEMFFFLVRLRQLTDLLLDRVDSPNTVRKA